MKNILIFIILGITLISCNKSPKDKLYNEIENIYGKKPKLEKLEEGDTYTLKFTLDDYLKWDNIIQQIKDATDRVTNSFPKEKFDNLIFKDENGQYLADVVSWETPSMRVLMKSSKRNAALEIKYVIKEK